MAQAVMAYHATARCIICIVIILPHHGMMQHEFTMDFTFETCRRYDFLICCLFKVCCEKNKLFTDVVPQSQFNVGTSLFGDVHLNFKLI